MYVVLQGSLLGETKVRSEVEPRLRHITMGSSVNVLCVLGIWTRCVETVTAEVQGVESYAVSATDFTNLFTAESDVAAFEVMQEEQAATFKMVHDDFAPTDFGRPLYLWCFSTVVLTLIEAKGLIDKGSKGGSKSFRSLPGKRGGKQGGGSGGDVVEGCMAWVVADLVDNESGRPFNLLWRKATKKATLRSGTAYGTEPFWNDVVRWSDITVPFEKAAVRVRLYGTDRHGGEVVCGTVVLRLTDLEAQSALATNIASTGSGAARLSGGSLPAVDEQEESKELVAMTSGGLRGSFRRGKPQAAATRVVEAPLAGGELESWFDLKSDEAVYDTVTNEDGQQKRRLNSLGAQASMLELVQQGAATHQPDSSHSGSAKSSSTENGSTVPSSSLASSSATTGSSQVHLRVLAKRPERAPPVKSPMHGAGRASRSRYNSQEVRLSKDDAAAAGLLRDGGGAVGSPTAAAGGDREARNSHGTLLGRGGVGGKKRQGSNSGRPRASGSASRGRPASLT